GDPHPRRGRLLITTAGGRPHESYSWRLGGSERTASASLISFIRSAAVGSPGFFSGCQRKAKRHLRVVARPLRRPVRYGRRVPPAPPAPVAGRGGLRVIRRRRVGGPARPGGGWAEPEGRAPVRPGRGAGRVGGWGVSRPSPGGVHLRDRPGGPGGSRLNFAMRPDPILWRPAVLRRLAASVVGSARATGGPSRRRPARRGVGPCRRRVRPTGAGTGRGPSAWRRAPGSPAALARSCRRRRLPARVAPDLLR